MNLSLLYFHLKLLSWPHIFTGFKVPGGILFTGWNHLLVRSECLSSYRLPNAENISDPNCFCSSCAYLDWMLPRIKSSLPLTKLKDRHLLKWGCIWKGHILHIDNYMLHCPGHTDLQISKLKLWTLTQGTHDGDTYTANVVYRQVLHWWWWHLCTFLSIYSTVYICTT